LIDGLRADLEAARQELGDQIDQTLQTATGQIDQAIEGLRLDLVPEALDPRALSETIRQEVRAVLPVTLPEIGQAVADIQELVNDEALSSFLSDPAGYVLNAVLSEARRRASPDLAGRLGRIIDRLLEEAIDPEVKQRLNEATTDNDA